MIYTLDYREFFDRDTEKRISDRLNLIESAGDYISKTEVNYAEDIAYLQDIICKMSIIVQAYEMKIKKLEKG